MNAPQESGTSTMLAVIVGVLIAIGIIGSILLVVLTRQRTPPLPENFFEEPGRIAGLLREDFGQAAIHRVDITKASIEIHAQRGSIYAKYTLSPKGDFLQRGGHMEPPEGMVALAGVDFSLVRPIVADATERAGTPPTLVVMSTDSGSYEWLASSGETDGERYVYRTDGSFLEQRNE
ncbi:MAG: hypothetical protein AAGI01_18560 [Myxococcota bacterium]